ncbi:MAG: hypothetical protein OXE94_10380 [Aestuariivita sp.]|nr:hypothetical protein [Aestuariivita sp.]MCY4203519.1 hypothetical protein [Aestuariivita sp.]
MTNTIHQMGTWYSTLTCHVRIPMGLVIATVLLAAATLAVATAVGHGWIIGNATSSVPRGVYLRSSPEAASHVSFCLDTHHHELRFYDNYCRPEQPTATRILKRIERKLPSGKLIVRGNTERSLDSRLLGPIAMSRIQGWWRPLIVIDPIAAAYSTGAQHDG